MRENGCDWGTNTCEAAAVNGHLSCLQWARENGCPEYDSEDEDDIYDEDDLYNDDDDDDDSEDESPPFYHW